MTIIIKSSKSNWTEIKQDVLLIAVQATLETTQQPDVDITVLLTDDEEMRQLNKTYRGLDKSTDVLAFNQEYIDPETSRLYLGDIVISVARAREQAQENNHSINKECALLAIHGTLHLVGYDHIDAEQRNAMWTVQDKIFKQLFNSY